MSIKYNGGYLPTVGADGSTLVANSSASTGVAWAGPSMAGGKNFIINGGFDFWQRGTTFTNPGNGGNVYTTDRWQAYFLGNGTVTQDTSLVYANSRYGARLTATASSATNTLFQIVETSNVVLLAGQTVTLSGYYAGTAGLTPSVSLTYSTTVDDSIFNIGTACTQISGSTPVLTSSFQRFSVTYTVPSTAKTLRIGLNAGAVVNTNYITFDAVQLELGSVATAFSRAGGTLQGELAACQRYYWRAGGDTAYQTFGFGTGKSTTIAGILIPHPVPMRTAPSSVLDAANLTVWDGATIIATPSSIVINTGQNGRNATLIEANYSSSTLSQYRPYALIANNSISAYIGFSAEL